MIGVTLSTLLSASMAYPENGSDQNPPHHSYDALARGMPAGAKKILKERANPPAAPLRLIKFRNTGSQGGPEGEASYGVDPLRMSLIRLQPVTPRVSVEVDAQVSSSTATDSDLTVKAIHRHIGDTVGLHGGEIDESKTPTVKPPGIHILDTVTRTIASGIESRPEKMMLKQAPEATISRSVKNLEPLKKQLNDGGRTYVAPSQKLLETLESLGRSREDAATGGTGGVEGPSGRKVKSGETTSSPARNLPAGVPKVSPEIPGTETLVQAEGLSDRATAASVPADNLPTGVSGLPATGPLAQPEGVGKDAATTQVSDQPLLGVVSTDGAKRSSVSGLFQDLNIPSSNNELPDIDFLALTRELEIAREQIDAQVAIETTKNAATEPIEGIQRKIREAEDKIEVGDRLEAASSDIRGGISVGLGGTSESIDAELAMMANKVAVAVGGAYDAVETQLRNQGAEERKKARDINVPSRKCRVVDIFGLCVGGETAESKSARATAQGEKDTHNKSADKFYGAAAKMPVQKVTAQASIYQKFGKAGAQVDDSLAQSVPPTTSFSKETGGERESDDSDDGGESNEPETEWGQDHNNHGTRSDNDYISHVNDDPSVVALVTLGSLIETLYSVTESINAAVGDAVTAKQSVGVIGSESGNLTVGSVMRSGADVGSINAAIGYGSTATQVIDSILDLNGDASVGSATFFTANGAEINVALAANSSTEMLITSVTGTVRGAYASKSVIVGPINATLGNQTSATTHLGAWEGNVRGSGSLNLQSTAALSAAIGDATEAKVRLGSQASSGRAHTLNITVVSEGALAAPLGYDATAIIEVGNVDGVTGNANVEVYTGPVISAALGSRTHATNKVANLGGEQRVDGSYRNVVKSGGLLAFALGDNTHAINALGSVEADVSGNVDISVTAGEVATGTVGERTVAETYLGSVLADVDGSVNINVVVGAVNTFAVGFSTGKDIYAKTYVGNVTSRQAGSNISASTGAIFNLGLGLVLDLGVGTLDFSKQGCVMIANQGSAPC